MMKDTGTELNEAAAEAENESAEAVEKAMTALGLGTDDHIYDVLRALYDEGRDAGMSWEYRYPD